MTTVSIFAGFAAALLCGILSERSLRGFRAGGAAASAISIALGLIVLQTSSAKDLLRIIHPKVALDGLPLICLAAAGVILIPSRRIRKTVGVALAILIPVNFLWGSVYLQPGEFEVRILVSMAIWSLALAVSLWLSDIELTGSKTWKTVVWIIATVVTAILIAMSGSLTYGAATGVCGLGILGVLISGAKIANIASVPLMSLIGLSAAFAELPVPIAGLLLLAWFVVLTGEQITAPPVIAAARISAAGLLLLAVTMMVIRMTNDHGSPETSNSGYGSLSNNSSVEAHENESLRSPAMDATRPKSRVLNPELPSQIHGEDSGDPFAGVEAE